MLQIVILICSTSLSPADCQKDTALDVVVGPQASNPMGAVTLFERQTH